MGLARPDVDILSPPDEFDAMVEWFERVSQNLVLLEQYPLADVRRALEVFSLAVREHIRTSSVSFLLPESPDGELSRPRSTLLADHVWFATSLEQLDGVYGVVAGDDHGGHRQALGQYGLVLAEALRRHRNDERSYLGAVRRASPAPPP